MASFWGLVVKSGEAQNVHLGEDMILTLTNAAFVGKTNETAKVYVSVDRKFVLATLTGGKTDQTTLDLTFFPGHQLSFGVDGQGEVHLVGSMQSYTSEADSDSEEDADAAELAHRGGISQKPFGKSSLLDIEADESGDGSLDQSGDLEDAEDEDEDEDEDEGEPFQPKAKPTVKSSLLTSGKKDEKPAEAAATPSKKDDKKEDKKATAASSKPTPAAAAQTPKGAKAADSAKKAVQTPTPSQKRPAVTPGDSDTAAKKSKPDTPKSAGGGIKCDQCPKTLPNQQALEQHAKAKHATK